MWATAGQLEMQSNKLSGVELFRAIGKTVAVLFLLYFNFSFQLHSEVTSSDFKPKQKNSTQKGESLF